MSGGDTLAAAILKNRDQPDHRQMHRIEQVERPLQRPGGRELPSGIAEDGNHSEDTQKLNGEPDPADPDHGAGNQPQDYQDPQKLKPLWRGSGKAEHDNEGHAGGAVVRLAYLRQCGKGNSDQHFQEDILCPLHAFKRQEAQQQRNHHTLIAPAPASGKGQIKGQLGKEHPDSQPQGILLRAFRVMRALRNKKAINGECDPSNHAQRKILAKQHRADMIDQHGHAGNDFQPLLGQSALFHSMHLPMAGARPNPGQSCLPVFFHFVSYLMR